MDINALSLDRAIPITLHLHLECRDGQTALSGVHRLWFGGKSVWRKVYERPVVFGVAVEHNIKVVNEHIRSVIL